MTAYSFTEATFVASAKKAIALKLNRIPDLTVRKAVRDAMIAFIEVLADELELIDGAA